MGKVPRPGLVTIVETVPNMVVAELLEEVPLEVTEAVPYSEAALAAEGENLTEPTVVMEVPGQAMLSLVEVRVVPPTVAMLRTANPETTDAVMAGVAVAVLVARLMVVLEATEVCQVGVAAAEVEVPEVQAAQVAQAVQGPLESIAGR